MTESVVSGKDTSCLFINNGTDFLTLKKVVSKKTDKDDEIQKFNTSVDTNGSEHVDVYNTSSLEPNFEMDSDTGCNITIGSICTQEDRESEIIYISNENSNEAEVNNGEKDIQVTSIKYLDVPYSPSDPLYDNDSHDLQDDYSELNNIGSPTSYFNILVEAPLHSSKVLDTSIESDSFLPEKKVLNNERKRKFEDLIEQDQKSTKILKLWNWMKYPFQKIIYGTSISEDKSIISTAKIVAEKENTIETELAVCENNSDNAKTKEKNTQNNFEADEEIKDSSVNVYTQPICNIM